jgi:hypothetical protein
MTSASSSNKRTPTEEGTDAPIEKKTNNVVIVDRTPASGPIDLEYVLGVASKFTDEQWAELEERKKQEAAVEIEKKKKENGQWLSINIPGPGRGVDVFIMWLGHPSDEDSKNIKRDYEALQHDVSSLGKGGTIALLDEWVTLGSPDDIKAGKGVQARCGVMDDPKVYRMFEWFYFKWSSDNEASKAEVRKASMKFNVPLGKGRTREDTSWMRGVSFDWQNIIWNR